MIPKAGIQDPSKAQKLNYEMATIIIKQLEGAQHSDIVDANSFSVDALKQLGDAADLIV
jgi:hypothetical protein